MLQEMNAQSRGGGSEGNEESREWKMHQGVSMAWGVRAGQGWGGTRAPPQGPGALVGSALGGAQEEDA